MKAKLEVTSEVLDGQAQVLVLRGELDVATASQLAQPLSDAGVVSLGDVIVVAGGHSAAGTQAAVGELVPAG